MQTQRVGSSDLKVSRICLGTMTFGSGIDEATSYYFVGLIVQQIVGRACSATLADLGGAYDI